MNGSAAFHRPPRSFPPALPDQKIVIAKPPELGRRGVGGLVQLLLPVLGTLGIVAFAVIMPNKLFLVVAGAFVLIAIFSVVASYWAQRRSGKLSARTERRLYRAHLVERERQLEQVSRQQREIDERLTRIRSAWRAWSRTAGTYGSADPPTWTSSRFAWAVPQCRSPARWSWRCQRIR